jgi:hypothetical protein
MQIFYRSSGATCIASVGWRARTGQRGRGDSGDSGDSGDRCDSTCLALLGNIFEENGVPEPPDAGDGPPPVVTISRPTSSRNSNPFSPPLAKGCGRYGLISTPLPPPLLKKWAASSKSSGGGLWEEDPNYAFSPGPFFDEFHFNKEIDRTEVLQPTNDLTTSAIMGSSDSSTGPDGIPFAAYRILVDFASPLLFNLLEHVIQGPLAST